VVQDSVEDLGENVDLLVGHEVEEVLAGGADVAGRGGLHGRTPEVIEHWYPLLNSGRVSLVLTGHDHEYQRFLSTEGTTFIVTGGGGRELYPLIPGCDPPEMRVGVVKNHFTGFEIYSDRMAVTAVATDGSVIDRVDIPAPLPAL